MGKYGSLVAFQQKGKVDKHKFHPGEFGRRLCQHIIGMNPLTIGEYTRPPPSEVVEKTGKISTERHSRYA